MRDGKFVSGVCFAGLFRGMFRGSVSHSSSTSNSLNSRVCFVVCFEGLFRGSVLPKSIFPALLKVALPKKCKPIYIYMTYQCIFIVCTHSSLDMNTPSFDFHDKAVLALLICASVATFLNRRNASKQIKEEFKLQD